MSNMKMCPCPIGPLEPSNKGIANESDSWCIFDMNRQLKYFWTTVKDDLNKLQLRTAEAIKVGDAMAKALQWLLTHLAEYNCFKEAGTVEGKLSRTAFRRGAPLIDYGCRRL